MDNLLSIAAIGIAALLAVFLGYFIGRSRATASLAEGKATEQAAQIQLDALRKEAASAQDLVSWRVQEERDAGDARVADARAAGERALGSALEAERKVALDRLGNLEATLRSTHQAAMEQAASERANREAELIARIAQIEEGGARSVAAEVARAQSRVAELSGQHDSVVSRLEQAWGTRESELMAQVLATATKAEVDLEAGRKRALAQLDEMRADHKRLADAFEALSAKALEANSATFLTQAEERMKRSNAEGAAELQRREEAVKQLILPIADTLSTVQSEVVTAEKARLEANAALSAQLKTMQASSESLNEETRKLVNALRSPQVRGRWGELQLRRVVEAAGMINHVDFDEQPQHETDEGSRRPDLVVHLAGDKQVVVDSKVAFSGYLEAMEATDEGVRSQKLTSHARHLRKHIEDLGAKEYWDAVAGSPEFVVMFVPAEPFLTAALDQDSTLFEHAFARNVIIATPSTLVALLRTVGHAWRQDQLANEAQQIFTVGKELHKRLGTVGDHLTRLGRSLNSTVENYNKFARSLDTQVVTQARRFSALQGLEPVLEGVKPIESLATSPQKDDLYGASVDGPAPDVENLQPVEA